MFRKTIGLLAGAALLGLTACASSPHAGAGAPEPDARLITRAEIDRGQWSNTYDLVRNLRPRWVQTRGPDTFQENPGNVQVYVDGMRLGPVDLLKTLPTSGIYYMEWVDPITAAGRWGLDHGHGVISISYRPAATDGS